MKGCKLMRKFFNSSRGPFEYSDSGEGDVILAIHGAMGGYDQSEILAEAIAPPGYRVIAVSRPGYLGTPISSGKSPENQADLYLELLNHLEIEKVTVMAISGGGYSALFFANRYPERCRSLLLCSTPGSPNNSKIPFSFKLFTVMARFKGLVGFLKKQSEKNFEKSLKHSIPQKDIREHFLLDKDTLNMFRRLSQGMFEDLNKRIDGTANDITVTRFLEYPLKDISVPTLVIHGSEDSVVPFEKHGKRLAEDIPGAELFLADRGEHVTIFTHRKAVREKVNDFLKRN